MTFDMTNDSFSALINEWYGQNGFSYEKDDTTLISTKTAVGICSFCSDICESTRIRIYEYDVPITLGVYFYGCTDSTDTLLDLAREYVKKHFPNATEDFTCFDRVTQEIAQWSNGNMKILFKLRT